MCSICFFCLLSHYVLIILPSDQIILEASVLLTSSVCHLAVRPGPHGLLLKLLQLGGGDKFPRDRAPTCPGLSEPHRPAAPSQRAGREGGRPWPLVTTFVRGVESSKAWPRTTQPNSLGGQHSCLQVHMAGCCGWQRGWTAHWKDTDIALSGLHSNACLLKPDHFGGPGAFCSELGPTLAC